jgi:choline dehydrogenase-like flavoprotein
MSAVYSELRYARPSRVINASVIAAVTSTNTNAPTIMIARKGAAMTNGCAPTTGGLA